VSGPGRSLEDGIKRQARSLGFSGVGIVRADPTEHREAYESWVTAERHGEMAYLGREDARARRYDLKGTLSGVRSVVVVTHDYPSEDPIGVPEEPDVGVIARYARGADYHDIIKPRLKRLHQWIEGEAGSEVAGRAYTDTGPILERDLARRAGLGWFGRNTVLIHPKRGSHFLLGVLLLDLELIPDAPFEADHCGTCRSCLDGCPTGALLGRDEQGAPVMDARLCISYLTIELRGPIPRALRPAIGNRVFGCDICQEVCPWNQRFSAQRWTDPAYTPGPAGQALPLTALMGMGASAWTEFSKKSPIRRAKRVGFLRNVAVALGNWASEDAVPVLVQALAESAPLVRGHAAWALGRIRSPQARAALETLASQESDAYVQEEVRAALAEHGHPRTERTR